jgi:ankyrin repeat protein
MIKGNKATTKLLLSVDNLNADILDTGGQTPLSHAAELGLGDIIQLLLDSNANINLEDKRGRTPLQLDAIPVQMSRLLNTFRYPDLEPAKPLS